jgi:hypothetical protein
MKPISFLLITVLSMLPAISEAAFLTCEDAENYGLNTAALFTSIVYAQANCDPELVQIYEKSLAKIGSNPISTSDTDEKKVCYFTGYYKGLTEFVSAAYGTCNAGETELSEDTLDLEEIPKGCPIEPPSFFGCIPIETIGMYTANILIGVSLSVNELWEADIQKIFDSEIDYAVCKEKFPGSCAMSIVSVLNMSSDFNDDELAELLICSICQQM